MQKKISSVAASQRRKKLNEGKCKGDGLLKQSRESYKQKSHEQKAANQKNITPPLPKMQAPLTI